jgi:hypothetical protein
VKKSVYYIVPLLALSFLWSCSTKKNTAANRFYHAFTSNYNIYYNGKTAYDEAFKSMQTGYKESYTDRILMYPVSAQPKDKPSTGGAFDRAIEKGNKAIKLHSIKAKPAKKPGWRNNPAQVALQQQEEYNPFLRKCWLLVGQGQFHNADFLQASATFSYIARHYAHDEETAAEARLWQARCYAEMDWLYESEDILHKLNNKGIPKKNLNQYAAVYADYLIKNQQVEEAIPYLGAAIKAEKNKLQRTRMTYLLGQLYAEKGMNALAYKTFGEVPKANPPYELEFAARIRQTEVFTGGNVQKVVRMLKQMAKSDKNKDYLDQVYYALGNVYLSRGDTLQAVQHYETGIEKSVQSGMDKAILWIRLGDIYFGQRNYIKAQPCFSGAAGIIAKEYRDYKRVAKLSAVLDELVVHVEAVHLQDSLQTLARMPEAERLAIIDKRIEQVIKEEKEAKEAAEKEAYLADAAAQGTGIDRPGTEARNVAMPVAGGAAGAGFYFYNPQAVAQGKTQFQQKWGRRPLEDDWRRRNKQVNTFEEKSEATTGADTPEATGEEAAAADGAAEAAPPDSLSSDPKTREYYLQQIPLTEEDIEASNLIIADGLYNMAMIYKDKLEDLPLSIEAFDELERRFPANKYLMESYYQVFLMALRTGNTSLADAYKGKLTAAFPGSDYAVAIADPDYEYKIRRMDAVQDSIYSLTYTRYLAEDIPLVRQNYEEVSANYPLAKLLPKFMFLNALTYVQENDAEGFKEALKALVEKYPNADVSALAGEMLKGVLRGRMIVQGGIKGMAWNLRFGAEDGEVSAADSARTFTTEKNTPYRMIFIYPTGSVDRNQLLFVVAAYNFANFMVKEFDLVQEEAGALSLLIVNGFIHFDEIMHYYRMIYTPDGYASSLSRDIAIVPISEENYETLMRGKTLDEYITFFEEHFAPDAPGLAERLKARFAEEEEKVEERVEEEKAEEEVEVEEEKEEAEVEQAAVEQAEEEKIEVEKEEEAEAEKEAEKEEPSLSETPDTNNSQLSTLNSQLRELSKEDLLKKQRAEEAALLKAKKEQEKQKKRALKVKQKQAKADRRAKLKAQAQLLKEKERKYKALQKQKKQERKQKTKK